MKTKAQKRNEARSNAEKLKAAKKAIRTTRGSLVAQKGAKGKSLVANSKKRK